MIASLLFASLLGYQLLDTLAKILNLRSLQVRVPGEFADVYNEHRYRRSQEYTFENARWDLVRNWCALLLLLCFWRAGGFEKLDLWLRSLQLPGLLTGLLYLFALGLASALTELPFDIYETFVIEQRFGFNRTTWPTFIADHLKQAALATVLAGLLLAAILWLFDLFGVRAWLIAWFFTALLSVLLLWVAPGLILPLFFKMKPVEEGELRRQITEFCSKQRFPVRDLCVIDGSRRSAKANAFFAGFGASKRIALYDTLINQHSIPELIGILAHEIGHFRGKHVLKHLAFSQVNLLLLFYIASLCLTQPDLFAAFGVSHPSHYVGIVLFLILSRPFMVFPGVIGNFMSRRHEFEADRFAAECLGDATPLIVALKKLSRDNLSNLTPHPLLVGLHFTHPPVLARIQALRRLFAASETEGSPGIGQDGLQSA